MFDENGALKAKFMSPHLTDVGNDWAFRVYPKVYLGRFSADGKFQSEVQLDFSSFIPYQLAVFPPGDLLPSGNETHKGRSPRIDNSFTGIYDKTGHDQAVGFWAGIKKSTRPLH